MNTPPYIVIDGQQAAVNLRAYLPNIGVTSEHYRHWVGNRIKELGLVEEKDYQLHKEGSTKNHMVTFSALSRMLGIGRLKSLHKQKREIEEVMVDLIHQGLSLPDSLAEFHVMPVSAVVDRPVPSASPLLAMGTLGPVAVLQIEGRAAVNAKDLFQSWQSGEDRYFTQWMKLRIEKFNLVRSLHYVEYKVAAVATTGRRVKRLDYLISLDAAITIANGEPTGRGKAIVSYLTEFRRELRRQKLSTKGKLADFIGLKPTEPTLVSSETHTGKEASELTTAQPTLFDTLPESQSEGVTKRDTLAEETTSSAEVDEQPSTGSGSEEIGPHRQSFDPLPSDSDGKPESTQEPKLPSVFEVLLQTAQLLLQQAQLLVDHEQRLQETRSTVGQIVAIGQQSALQTLGLSVGAEQPPQQTLRSRIRQIVNHRCRKTGEFQDQVYAFIYNRLYYLYGVSVTAHHRQKDESYLELCERLGILDKVYSIVTSHEFTVALTEAPVQPRSQAA